MLTRQTIGEAIVAGMGLVKNHENSRPFDACGLAEIFGVHRRTVQRWIAAGKLRGHSLGRSHSKLRVTSWDVGVAFAAAMIRGDGRMTRAMMRREHHTT